MTARRLAVFGLVILLAVLAGVFLRRETMNRTAGAPPSASSPSVAGKAPESAPPAPAPSGVASGTPQAETPSAPAAAEAPAGTRPSFDVVRVEPNGSSVVAGRTVPGGTVELLSNGNVIDRTKANEQGEFVLMPPPLQPGSYELTLRSPDAASTQAVTVSVPEKGQGEVLVVVGEPGKPSQVVQAGPPSGPSAGTVPDVPGAVPEAANPPQPLRIGAVEAEGGRLFVQGTGPSGSKVAIYLNDTLLSEARIGADGRWSLTVEKGLAPGDYTIRVDQPGADGKIVARVEVPFTAEAGEPVALAAVPSAPAQTVPSAPAETAPSSAGTAGPPSEPETTAGTAAPAAGSAPESGSGSAPQTAVAPQAPEADQAANPVVRQLGTVTVKRGDSLWRISRRVYGRGIRYSTIYDANSDQIRDPDRIYPGQVFVMPGG